MNETIYERAATSAFQNQVDQGIDQPSTQLKTIERRAKALSKNQESTPSFESIIAVFTQGLLIHVGGSAFIAQLTELQTAPKAGLLKWLMVALISNLILPGVII
jgi:hypothetical protein